MSEIAVLTLMIQFGLFVVTLISLVLALVLAITKRK